MRHLVLISLLMLVACGSDELSAPRTTVKNASLSPQKGSEESPILVQSLPFSDAGTSAKRLYKIELTQPQTLSIAANVPVEVLDSAPTPDRSVAKGQGDLSVALDPGTYWLSI